MPGPTLTQGVGRARVSHISTGCFVLLTLGACATRDVAPDQVSEPSDAVQEEELQVDVQTGGALLLIEPVDPDDRVDLILFLNDDVLETPGDEVLQSAVEELMKEVAQHDGVMMIQYFSQEMAEEEYVELFGDEEQMMERFEGLMLPTSLRIWTTSDNVTESLVSRYKDDPRIRSVGSGLSPGGG